MRLNNNIQTIKDLTYKMSRKERFAFVNFSKSALLAASGKLPHEKKPPKYFTKSIIKSLEIEEKNYMKSIPSYMYDSQDGLDFSSITGLASSSIYDASTIEDYFMHNKSVFDSFVDFYIKYSKTLVVSFHDKKVIQKIIGSSCDVITIPYNDFYDKLDQIFDQISAYDGKVDYCIFDCPVLSSALASKVWEKTNMSILDFGKVFTISSK
jgi:hypothetical protein